MSKKITLACKDCNKKNYWVNKTLDKRLEVKKFCKDCVKHTLHKEEK